MITLGCILTAILFVGLFGMATALLSSLTRTLCNGWWVRFILKYFFINSMGCRVFARSLGSDVLD
jgi:hypothetical protein